MSLEQIQDTSFVTTLNNNLSSITLPSELNGYTLSTWCTSSNGPVLDYQVSAQSVQQDVLLIIISA